jgi:hypothetical protein
MPKFQFEVDDAVADSMDPWHITFKEVMGIFNQVSRPSNRRQVEKSRDGKSLELSFGELGEYPWKTVTIHPNLDTGVFEFEYRPPQNNPWKSHEAKLRDIFEMYFINLEQKEAAERMRDVRGLTEVSKSGLPVPEDVQSYIASFLTGEKGTTKMQVASLKKKVTGQGRRKPKTKRISKKRRTTRRR